MYLYVMLIKTNAHVQPAAPTKQLLSIYYKAGAVYIL